MSLEKSSPGVQEYTLITRIQRGLLNDNVFFRTVDFDLIIQISEDSPTIKKPFK